MKYGNFLQYVSCVSETCWQERDETLLLDALATYILGPGEVAFDSSSEIIKQYYDICYMCTFYLCIKNLKMVEIFSP